MDEITTKLKAFATKGVTITLAGNYPWVYIETINGKPVTEKHASEHGFVFAVYQLKGGVRFTDEEIINNLINNYL